MKCKLCNRIVSEVYEAYCPRCEKIQGDVFADFAAELGANIM